MKSKREARLLRKARIRKKVSGTSEMPRLLVYKSLRHIYVQVVDDSKGNTLVSASTLEKQFQEEMKPGKNRAAAERIGEMIGDRVASKGIGKLVFDRNGYRYHGKISGILEKVREKGIQV